MDLSSIRLFLDRIRQLWELNPNLSFAELLSKPFDGETAFKDYDNTQLLKELSKFYYRK